MTKIVIEIPDNDCFTCIMCGSYVRPNGTKGLDCVLFEKDVTHTRCEECVEAEVIE